MKVDFSFVSIQSIFEHIFTGACMTIGGALIILLIKHSSWLKKLFML